MKGKVTTTVLSVAGKAIDTVMGELVKGLCRVYDASLIDDDAVQHIRKMIRNGLRQLIEAD